ncbi:MAG: hypothetical protein DRQ49_02470 [Gammaproteobacteria bacterium]|nr:MAG: hypothetical protein DRQ49_02470 [Gammaproteobacteria bacterium]
MNATTNIPSSNFDGEGNETLDRKETEIRIDSKGDQPEKDDALIHDKIDKPDDIDKYSGYDLHNESTDADKLMDSNHKEIEIPHHESKDSVMNEAKEGNVKEGNDVLKKSDDAEKPHNEVSDKVSTQLDNENHIQSPGTCLRQAREQNNMSLKHVADRLYLDSRVIEALEMDNYQGLPPTIFVRGYLRNYAKLMDIAPESIMVAFDQQPHTSAPSLKAAPLKRNKQTSSQDLWPTVATIVVIVTLMTLMALWKFYPPSTATDETPIAGTPIGPHDSSWNADFDQMVGMNTDHTTETDEPKTTQYSEQGIIVSTTTVQSPPAVVSIIQADDSASSLPSNKKGEMIRVFFKQRVWMRITDKTGEQLYEGIGNAGKRLSLNGIPPFKLKVGNTGVDIEYQGNTQNIKAYPGQKLKFTIGAE